MQRNVLECQVIERTGKKNSNSAKEAARIAASAPAFF
jgi:hypothetical protein